MTLKADVQSLNPGSDISLFEVDANSIGAGTLRFHGYTSTGVIWWQGYQFLPWPIRAEGFARTSERPPTPTLSVGNIDGSISAMCAFYQDMVGAKVTRHRTLVKYLDSANIPIVNVLPQASRVIVGQGWASNGTGHVYNYAIPGPFNDGLATRVSRVTAGGGVYASVTNRFPITAGQTFTVSAWVRSDMLTRIRMVIDLMPASSTTLTNINTMWSRISVTATATANIAGTILLYPVTADGADWSFEVYGVQINEGPLADFQAKPAINPDADPNEHFPPEIWHIERKAGEEEDWVQFELCGYDLNGLQLPSRPIIPNHCPWVYRSAECGYDGGPVATARDVATADPLLDKCSKKISGCKWRFGENGVLRHGGFPAAGLMRS